MPDPAGHKGAVERVAVWHTNVVMMDVPVGLSEAEATEYVLQRVDDGDAAFHALEAGVFYDARGDIPQWWLDHA